MLLEFKVLLLLYWFIMLALIKNLTKQCSPCLLDKNTSDFSIRDKSTRELRSWCKDCCNADNRARHYKQKNDPGYAKERAKKARIYRSLEEKKQSLKNADLKNKYGITKQYWDELFASQKGSCAICERHQSELKKTLCVDHCHKTGKVRGLLCHECNSSLGLLKDNPDNCIKAASYLNKGRM